MNNKILLHPIQKLILNGGYDKQQVETPSISQIRPQDETYRPQNITKTVTRQNPTMTEDDQFIESLLASLNGQ